MAGTGSRGYLPASALSVPRYKLQTADAILTSVATVFWLAHQIPPVEFALESQLQACAGEGHLGLEGGIGGVGFE